MIAGNTNKQKLSSATPTTAETETPEDQGKLQTPKNHRPGFDTDGSNVAEDHQKRLHLLRQPEGWGCRGFLCTQVRQQESDLVGEDLFSAVPSPAIPSQKRFRSWWWEQEEMSAPSRASLRLFNIQVVLHGYQLITRNTSSAIWPMRRRWPGRWEGRPKREHAERWSMSTKALLAKAGCPRIIPHIIRSR